MESISNKNNFNLIDIDNSTKVKVSSVFNNNTVDNGKQNMFDGNDDTSWYSDQGKFQYVFICFDNPGRIDRIEITGSGGFCPKVFKFIYVYEVEVSYSEKNEFMNKKPDLKVDKTFFLEDVNEKQVIYY
jgi:hypothetical protein